MEAIDSVMDPLRHFARDSVRFLIRCDKPNVKEFMRTAIPTAIGFAVLGGVGFFVKYVFIVINNIILS